MTELLRIGMPDTVARLQEILAFAIGDLAPEVVHVRHFNGMLIFEQGDTA